MNATMTKLNELYRKHQAAIRNLTLSQWAAMSSQFPQARGDRDIVASILAKREFKAQY